MDWQGDGAWVYSCFSGLHASMREQQGSLTKHHPLIATLATGALLRFRQQAASSRYLQATGDPWYLQATHLGLNAIQMKPLLINKPHPPRWSVLPLKPAADSKGVVFKAQKDFHTLPPFLVWAYLQQTCFLQDISPRACEKEMSKIMPDTPFPGHFAYRPAHTDAEYRIARDKYLLVKVFSCSV